MGSADSYYRARPENSDGHGYAGIARIVVDCRASKQALDLQNARSMHVLRHGV